MSSDFSTSSAAESAFELPPERGRWLAWWLRPKVAIPLCLVVLLVSAPLCYRGYKLSLVPPAPEPFDTQAVLDLVVPDDQNAWVEYRQAIAKVVLLPSVEERNFDKARKGEWADVPESLRKWVRDNREAIDLFKRGSEKPDAQYCRAGEIGLYKIAPDTQVTRSLFDSVWLDAMRLRAEGKPDQAWDLLRALLRASQHAGRRGVMFEECVGLQASMVMHSGLLKWAQDPIVTAEMLQRAQLEFDEEFLQRRPISSTIQVEYLFLRGIVRSPNPAKELSDWFVELPFPKLGNFGLYIMGEPELGDRCMSHVIRNYLSQVDKPRRERTQQTGRYMCFEPEPTASSLVPTPIQLDDCIDQTIVRSLFLPSMSQFVTSSDLGEVKYSLLKTVLCLEIYRRQDGSYPETLALLVPDFMAEIPDDIFEPTPTPLKYRRDGDNARLWGAGHDRVDNAGAIENGDDLGFVLGPPKPEPVAEPMGEALEMPE